MPFGRRARQQFDRRTGEPEPGATWSGSERRGRGSFLLQDVPNSAHGLQQAGAAALLELLPQIPDIDVDHVTTRAEIETPHRVQQLLAAEHLTGVAHEVLKQVELLCR